MSRLKKLEPQIKEILFEQPATRKDDFLLINEVYSNYIPLAMPVGEALKNHKKYNLPSFASIIRVRRKLQSTDPSLCDAETVNKRVDAAGDYIDYSRGLDNDTGAN